MPKKKQGGLFEQEEPEEEWKKEWAGMPEFLQEDLTSHNSIIVHFKNEEDAAEFAKLVEQTITPRTQSIWYPKAKIDKYMNKRYKRES